MTGVLESRLRITAVDDTAAAFASVEARISEMQKTLSGISPAVASVGTAARNVAPAARAVAAAPPPPVASSSGGDLFSTLLGVATTVTGVEAVRGGFQEAVGQQHERIRQQLAGMTAEQIAEGQKLAADLARKYPSVPQSEIMHLLRTGTTVTGDFEEASQLMEPMTRLRVIAQAARPHASTEETTEEMDKLLKSMEIAGVTTKPDLFREYIGSIAKSLNAFGDQMRPSDYFEMLKYARQAGSKLSERFLMTTMTTLGSEIGGASIGTAVASFNRAMVGGHMEHAAGVEMAGLGLFGENDLMRLSTGEIKGVKRGAHVKEWRLAQSDPDLWIQQVLMPALAAHGFKSSDEIAAEVSKLYPNRTAGQFVSEVTTQGAKLSKNTQNWRKALSDEAADILASSDINAASSGFGNRLKNLIANEIPTDALARGLGWLGSGLTSLLGKPQTHSLMEDLSTDIKGWSDVFKSIHVGSPSLSGERWSAAADDRKVVAADWNARYFGAEAAADAAREHSRALALSNLPGGRPAARDVTVSGEATVNVPVSVTVTASSELLRVVDDARQAARTATAQVPLNPVAGGHTGRMDSDAAPGGHFGHN